MDHHRLLDCAMDVLNTYEVILLTNEEMLTLYDIWFPFVKPRVKLFELSNSDLEMRHQVLSNKKISSAYNLLEIENNFIQAQLVYAKQLKQYNKKK